MKTALILGCLAMVTPLAVAAQNGGQSYGMARTCNFATGKCQETTLTVTLPSPCAVSLQAKHLPDGEMMKTGAAPRKGPWQGLHLSMTSPDSRIISSAVVNLRGWDHAGFVPASADEPGQAVRTETVRFAGIQGRTASADVWAPGLNSVTSIDLMAVTFADGSTWKPAAGYACRIAPDALMLVSQF